MEHIEFTYTSGMDESELTSRLAAAQTGVLALARENDAYAIPVAHYFDGEQLFLRLALTEDSTKQSFWEHTETARYVVHETEPTEKPRGIDSWSVIASGELRELTPEELERFQPGQINRRFAPLRIFDESIPDIDIRITEFEIETMTGRITADQA